MIQRILNRYNNWKNLFILVTNPSVIKGFFKDNCKVRLSMAGHSIVGKDLARTDTKERRQNSKKGL